MRTLARHTAWLLSLAAALAPAAQARELWSRGEASLEWTGSVKEIVTSTKGTDSDKFRELAAGSPACVLAVTFPDCPAFRAVGDRDVFVAFTRVRNRFDLRLDRRLSGVVIYDHELSLGVLDTLGRDIGEGFRVDQLFDLDWQVRVGDLPSENARWRHTLYRAYLKLETKRIEAVVGRQLIPWGVGRLWQPTDRFNAIPPLAIEGDQKPGVDAVNLRWNFSGFTFLEAVYQPNSNSDDAAYAMRFHGTLGEADYSLLGGRWEGAWAAGMDFAANLGDAAVRLEAIWTSPTREVWEVTNDRPKELSSFWQIVVSADYNVNVGRGLYVLVEHLYNGNALGVGEGRAGTLLPLFEASATPPRGVDPALGPFVQPADEDIFGGSRVITNARHTTGLQLGYDLTPILRGDLLVLYDWNDESAVFAPVLTYSPIGSLELSLASQIFTGPRRSQYGSGEHLVYATAEWFF